MKTLLLTSIAILTLLSNLAATACGLKFRIPVPGTYHLLQNYNWVLLGLHHYNNTVGDYDEYTIEGTYLRTIENQGTDSDWEGTNVIPATHTGSMCNFYSSSEGGAYYGVESCGDFPGESDYDNWLVLWY